MSVSDSPAPDSIAGLRVQNGALRTVNASLESEIAMHRAKAQLYHAGATTLESEREANAQLTEELDALNRKVDVLGEKLYLLSGLLRAAGFLDKPDHHAAYEAVVAAFLATSPAATAVIGGGS